MHASMGAGFWLYGSGARGQLRFDSDIDLLLDFTEDMISAAWRFAEDACAQLGLEPDIRPLAWCKPQFLNHIRSQLVELA